MSVTHRIRHQRWQLRAASAADAFALRATLRRENELNLLPALEAAFDACAAGERDIHLPRLELTVRVSSLENLAKELPGKLTAAATQALAEAVADLSADESTAPRDLSPAARLRNYLHSGQVAWFDADRDPAEVARQLADEARQWSTSPAAAWLDLLSDLPPDGPVRSDAFFRFLQLLDAAGRVAWWDFAERLGEAVGGDLSAPLRLLHQLQAGRPADHALRLQALALLLLAGDPTRSPARRAEWLAAVQACAGQLGLFVATIETTANPTVDRKNWLKIENLFDEVSDQKSWQNSQSAHLQQPTVNSLSNRISLAHASVNQQSSPIFPIGAGSPGFHGHGTALGQPVHLAGLILLHPYLPRLFSAFGWVAADHRQGEPFPSAALPRAAALLYWLATGRDEPYEFALGTIKLLLGLSPDAALPVATGLLGEAEREEGEALLGAVVAHWSALGKTSIDGLRVSFLQRSGLLYPADDGWLLRPQAESFDLLLDRLPWGIAIVRLPWMSRSLHTEWLSA